MGLYDLFLQAANAKAHAPIGDVPTFGDALQGIGNSMKNHYLGTPEKIATLPGTFPGMGQQADPIASLIAGTRQQPQGQALAGQSEQMQAPALPPAQVLARPGATPLSMLGAIFGQHWGQAKK